MFGHGYTYMCKDLIFLQNEGGVGLLIMSANVDLIADRIDVGGEICIGVW